MRAKAPNLRGHVLALMVLLVVQFLLGMWINLFVVLPGPAAALAPAGAWARLGWASAAGPWALQAHIVLGLVLGAMGIGHLVRVWRGTPRVGLGWSLAGLVGVAAASVAGALFLSTAAAAWSMAMAAGFAVALVAYGMAMAMPGHPAVGGAS